MRDYKKIKAFQEADKLVKHIYKITQNFSKEEIYGLTSQIRRAGISVPANIVEGASRQHKKDYLNFLYIARASLAEMQYLIHLSSSLQMISHSELEKLDNQIGMTSKILYGLISSVSNEISN